MAIVFTARANMTNSRNLKVWDVTCLDADTGPTTQAHAMGATPLAWFVKHVSAAAQPEWSLLVDDTNVTLTKLNAAGSGGAVPGTTFAVTVFVMRPTSLVK
jgi:hypothetical protein